MASKETMRVRVLMSRARSNQRRNQTVWSQMHVQEPRKVLMKSAMRSPKGWLRLWLRCQFIPSWYHRSRHSVSLPSLVMGTMTPLSRNDLIGL